MVRSFCLLLLLVLAYGQIVEEEEGVLVLTDKNFNMAMKQHDYILVEFYAPWCSHCQDLAPQLAGAAKELKKEFISVGKVDATENKQLQSQYQIKGYPTLKFFRNGKAYEYKGKRDKDGIVEWMKIHSVPRMTSISDQAELEQFHATQGLVLMYFGSNQQKSIELNAFESLADKFEGVYFGYAQSQELRQWLNLGLEERVVLYTPYENREVIFRQEINEINIREFLDQHSYPLVFSLNDREVEFLQTSNKGVIYLFQDSLKNDWLDEAFNEVARLKSDRLQFVSINKKKPQERTRFLRQKFDSTFQLKRFPQVYIENVKDGQSIHSLSSKREKLRYRLEKEVDGQSILAFVEQWERDDLEPWFKSEKMPLTNVEPVRVVVGLSYQWEVLDHEKDVLLFIYAPWCNVSKKFMPVYQTVAAELKQTNPNIILAKIDGTENEIPGIYIADYPTIKFFRKGEKLKLIDFRGEKSEQHLLKFLKENTSFPWNEPTQDQPTHQRDDL